ncbi:Protein of unknown function [Ruminococcaceae bacterium YRB3002]|nr:Protein of unknown function [Ruminococcaceae bacterium YRB3002]
MSSEQLVRNCAPTLAGIKTGSLYAIQGVDMDELKCDLSALNRTLISKGVRIIPLKMSDDKVLIYIYRPQMLKKDLSDPNAQEILSELGYSLESVEVSVVELILRLRSYGSFPHEIGLFLGYPPSDVRGFIHDPNNGYVMSGYWKVYSNEDKARDLFRRYKTCTREYERMLMAGRPLEQLVV